MPGHGPYRRERVHSAKSPRDNMPCARDSTRCGFQASKTAKRRRHPDAASGVRSEVHCRATGCDDRASSPAAATGRPAHVIRVVGLPVDQVVGLERERKLRGVGLSQDDGASFPHPCDCRGVRVRNEVLTAKRPAGRDNAFSIVRVLDCDGHAMQWTQRLATGESRIRLTRFGHRAITGELHNRVELGVYLVNASQVGIDYLNGRHLFGLYGSRN